MADYETIIVRTRRADRPHHAQPAGPAQQLHRADARRTARRARRASAMRASSSSPVPGAASAPGRISTTARSRRARPVDLGETVETVLEPADPHADRPAAAGHRPRERRRGRRRRQHRARLRHRGRGEVGQVHPELLGDRPDPRQRRHLGAAAPRRPGARARPGADRRAAARREGRRMGPDLEMRRGRGARRRSRCHRQQARRRFRRSASPRSRR